MPARADDDDIVALFGLRVPPGAIPAGVMAHGLTGHGKG